MNRDDIIRMAREVWGDDSGKPWHESAVTHLEAFAALVAAEIMPKETLAEMFEWGKDAGRREEREACAKVCEQLSEEYAYASEEHCAEAIRARGQQ